MHSCIYEGNVTHCRFLPVKHRFQYRLFMLYLDLEELHQLVGTDKLVSNRRFSLASFIQRDHLDGQQDLASQIRQLVRDRTGHEVAGRIRLLTQLRYFGYYFSPINLFYISDSEDRRVDYVVAEVNNTPWGQRHCYVLGDQNRIESRQMRFVHRKAFHVSPFMDMDMDYHWTIGQPAEKLSVGLQNHRSGQKIFSASLSLRRRELSRGSLLTMSCRYPWMTAQIITAIHYQALKLWWKKCPVYIHPEKRLPSPPKSVKNPPI